MRVSVCAAVVGVLTVPVSARRSEQARGARGSGSSSSETDPPARSPFTWLRSSLGEGKEGAKRGWAGRGRDFRVDPRDSSQSLSPSPAPSAASRGLKP